MKLIEVDFSNYKKAIEIQRQIFPNEDGTLNILASLNRDLFIKKTGLFYIDDHVKYYLAIEADSIIGITGLYNYGDDNENVWIGWFGILKSYQHKGLGKKLLMKTCELAKEKGFEFIRLYTDINENKEAVILYEKVGFVKEKYLAEKLSYDCYLFSKSLSDKPVYLWGNKKLDLVHQSELDQADDELVRKALAMYE